MLWFFSLYFMILPLEIFSRLISYTHLNFMSYRFLMLGQIPGTNFQITFQELLYGLWAILFVWVTIRLNKRNHFINLKSLLLSRRTR